MINVTKQRLIRSDLRITATYPRYVLPLLMKLIYTCQDNIGQEQGHYSVISVTVVTVIEYLLSIDLHEIIVL